MKWPSKAWWGSPGAVCISVLLLPVLAWAGFELFVWAVVHAVFRPDLAACEALAGRGACWGVVAEKWNLILFGRCPPDEQWRAAVVIGVFSVMLFATVRKCLPHRFLWASWLVLGGASVCLLSAVPTTLWGGLALTLLLSVLGFGMALPLGIALALGRRCKVSWLSWICATYIELMRALPLVTVLFLAAFVLPLYLPGDGGDLFVRVLFTVSLFCAAYLAEVMRGGLQSVSPGQTQAAQALGLRGWQVQTHVVVPQALQACYPGLVNSFVTLFKECSLVSIVSLFEITGSLGLALAGDVQWRAFYFEGYLFVALVYWLYCYGLGKNVKLFSNQGPRP